MIEARMKRILDYCFLADCEPLNQEDALIDKANELALMRAETPLEAATITIRRFQNRCNATSPTTATSLFLPFSMSAEHFDQYWADQEAAFTCCCGDDMDNHAWDETHSPTSYASHARHLRAMELREVFGADPDSSNDDLVAAFFNNT